MHQEDHPRDRFHSRGRRCFAVLCLAAAVSNANAQSTVDSIDVSGLWKGRRSFGGFSTEVSLRLRQSGSTVVGTASWELSPSGLGGTGGPLEGLIVGNTMNFKVPVAEFTGEVTISGHQMRGQLVGPFPYVIELVRVE